MIKEIRASQLSRYISCQGFAKFTDLPEFETNPIAEAGTAFGDMMTDLIYGRPIKQVADNGVRIDNDMKFYGQPIYEDILSRAEGNEITSELRIDFNTPSGIKMRGQYDVCFRKGNTLYIEDFKYGFRTVEVKENWQLITYALGKIINDGKAPEFVSMSIHQPRAFHEEGRTRTWVIPYSELMEYYKRILDVTDRIAKGDTTLTVGEHCRYCPALTMCTASNRHTGDVAEYVYSQPWEQKEMSNDDLSEQHELMEKLSEIVKIKKDALEAMISHRVKLGQVVGDFQVIPKIGNRTWKDDVDPKIVEDMIRMFTGKEVCLTTTEMISPNKAEKGGLLPKELVSQFTFRPQNGTNLKRVNVTKDADKLFGKGE